MMLFFVKLLLAHFIGDFLFQPKKWVTHKLDKKHKSKFLYYHILVHFVALVMVLKADFASYWLGFIIIIVSHYSIDVIKLHLNTPKNTRLLFFIDQMAHLLVLFLVTAYYTTYPLGLGALVTPKTIIFLTFLLFATSVASVFMKIIISKWNLDTADEDSIDSLEHAGAYIGVLERLFVFLFIITDHWEGVGFLMAAKSIFRFGDLSKAKDRKLTEYVLIGTLVSFMLAIIAGLCYLYFTNNV
ncbi:DUF3307 domain-containing protein [Lacinutrix neustonica]|uniref:DUF3307 domain-containing protein n=1 Tax=Lacinutrix neustonica TaxID=2980107 RepID=A0A9E8MVL1_9FLAO|nr:DUF3307 domain-containing protein [Lacinutrix neustonica]WAC02303.1 DUF3307 domain-containing protein [Lacinutrix neustonica]